MSNIEEIYLGITEEHGKVYLTKHSWDCAWYWGFGYVRSRHCHFHFESFLTKCPREASVLFNEPTFSDRSWWIIRDLFIQAYALKEAAATYHYGGHQCTSKGITDIIQCKEMELRLNKDLEIVLNKVWQFMLDNQQGH